MDNTNITIDGPGGAGKSTVAKIVADKLNYIYIDTGAMYRVIAYLALEQNIDLDNQEQLAQLAQGVDITFAQGKEGQQVLANGKELSGEIRTPSVTRAVSKIAKHPQVRQVLVACQQRLAALGNSVLDGRDTGTCVLPQAKFKFFLTASAHQRAVRRTEELLAKGHQVTVTQVQQELEERDKQDREREVAPLVAAADALLIDTSQLTIEQVVEQILQVVEGAGT